MSSGASPAAVRTDLPGAIISRTCSDMHQRPRVVLVAYADWQCATGPSVEEVFELAREHAGSVMLLDTHCKDANAISKRRPTLLDWLSAALGRGSAMPAVPGSACQNRGWRVRWECRRSVAAHGARARLVCRCAASQSAMTEIARPACKSKTCAGWSSCSTPGTQVDEPTRACPPTPAARPGRSSHRRLLLLPRRPSRCQANQSI